jgi:hypothetical protein
MAYSKAYARSVGADGKEFMLKPLSMLLAATVLVLATTPVAARPKERTPDSALEARPKERAPDSALQARQQGRILPLPEIEARIRQQMRDSDYLGPELDTVSGIYRLKFLRGERVIWIDVDGRTGQIVGTSGR